MSTWPLERQLTVRCGAVMFVCLLIAVLLWHGARLNWYISGECVLLTLLAMAVFRLLMVPEGRRLHELLAAARRLAASDVGVRLAWAERSAPDRGDSGLTARVNTLAERFAATFREGFALDESAMVTVGKLSTPTLRCGRQALNLNDALVDGFGANGESATLFVRWHGNFVRISTSLRKPDGSRAVGTLLDRSSPAYAALTEGRIFTGKVRLFGCDYATRYVPICGSGGEILGALYVGISIPPVIDRAGQLDALGYELNAAAEEMSRFVHAIAGSGEEVVDSTISLAENMTAVASASSRQSAAAQSIGIALEQMTVSIDRVADGARETKAIAGSSRQASQAGATAVAEAAQEIGEIAAYVDRLSDGVSSLGERSGDIRGIIDVIRKISDKTSMLALNAAVEAARAGEHGRGFAIVAGEIRALAVQSGEATQRIADLIEDIRTRIDSIVQEMQSGRDRVRRGVELASTARGALMDIMQGAEETVDKVLGITAATDEQAAASKEIARNFDAVVQGAQHEAESVREIAREVSNLEQLSARFHSLVYRFSY